MKRINVGNGEPSAEQSPSAAAIVRNAREKLGCTQGDFAVRLGSKQSLISKYEAEQVSPPAELLIHCMNICRDEERPDVSARQLADLVMTQLPSEDLAEVRAAIAALILSLPNPGSSGSGRNRA